MGFQWVVKTDDKYYVAWVYTCLDKNLRLQVKDKRHWIIDEYLCIAQDAQNEYLKTYPSLRIHTNNYSGVSTRSMWNNVTQKSLQELQLQQITTK